MALDFSAFSKGVYLLEIESKKGRFLEKVVIE
jgi:16S rRNA G527 N7-methylase RsmG